MIRFSVWDNWELLEESAGGTQWTTSYLQGATGVIKSWGGNGALYYYQDKLGSTTHIANASGGLLESYKYDLYGTPSYYDQNGQPKANQVSGYGVNDLYAGERWVSELALYDLRNRFMSSELGRFLHPDPIGFKGDASNLYRYCGNDPIDKTDPMGLDAVENPNADDSHRYSYYLQPQLKSDALNRWIIAKMDGRTTRAYECAAAAAILAGTWRADGLHRAPDATRWLRGPDVTARTPRVGALVAKGWDKDGHYYNTSNQNPKTYRGNHAGIFLGFGDKTHQYMKILDQWIVPKTSPTMVKPLAISIRPTAGYARVDSSAPYQAESIQVVLRPPPGPQSPADGEISGPSGGGAGISHPPVRFTATQ